jgi:F-type H+-transporting ATPase subunit gamma
LITSVDVEKKIKVLSSLGDIIGAMKAYAGVAIRKTEDIILNIREYEKNVLLALADVISCDSRIPAEERKGAKRLLVVFGSSQGLCGSYNEKITDTLSDIINTYDSLFVIGNRLKSSLESRGIAYEVCHDSVVSVSGIGQALRECISQLMNFYRDKDCYYLTLVFTSISGKQAGVSVEQILPPDISLVNSAGSFAPLPLMHLGPEFIFDRLLEQFIGISLYRCFVESVRSENWYRLKSMEGASENIQRRISDLDSLRKYVRQEEITEEMLEIFGSGGFYRQ